jgi:hypothetical protein
MTLCVHGFAPNYILRLVVGFRGPITLSRTWGTMERTLREGWINRMTKNLIESRWTLQKEEIPRDPPIVVQYIPSPCTDFSKSGYRVDIGLTGQYMAARSSLLDYLYSPLFGSKLTQLILHTTRQSFPSACSHKRIKSSFEYLDAPSCPGPLILVASCIDSAVSTRSRRD